jgi:ABC-type polysaccharide/polyol phosphate transport system ATPase subunit
MSEDTGYENIMTCGMYLGMTKDEILRKIPEIEEFSELGEYLSAACPHLFDRHVDPIRIWYRDFD